MSEQIVIQAKGLGKSYIIGHLSNDKESTVRDLLVGTVTNFGRRFRDLFRGKALVIGDQTEEFKALNDVSFSITRGEIVGVIGHNGAGKSTLLKVLSRITEPTRGRVEITGRVSSLLEVGTGFHPELTGRENIYLNGAILGMSRAEIRSKFDEIVEFAGVAKFLDTPVKRYSSGMYVRLAFSVAAHLEPEIMIVDEVLAVGDQEFQNKCLGKMRDVASSGRTVLFVSHNLHSVASLCTRVIAMSGGQIIDDGEPSAVIEKYLLAGVQDVLEWVPEDGNGGPFHMRRVWISGREGEHGAELLYGKPVEINMEYDIDEPMSPGRLAIRLINEYGTNVLSSADTDAMTSMRRNLETGAYRSKCTIPGNLLTPGRYSLVFSEPTAGGSDVIHEGKIAFTISSYGSPSARDGRRDVISPLLPWETVSR